jgi:pheromone a factor receptor
MRLVALAMMEMICTTPLAAFIIWLNVTAQPPTPWDGLADAHFQFSHVRQTPAILWREDHLLSVSLELTRWLAPVCAIVFFAFFGFAEEAPRHYLVAVMKSFGFMPRSPQSSVISSSRYAVSFSLS